MQGLEEHFRDSCGGVIKWLDQKTYYTAFTEGWGLYAENPLIGEDTDTYKDEPWQKYGMLKWQVGSYIQIPEDLWSLLCQSFSTVLQKTKELGQKVRFGSEQAQNGRSDNGNVKKE